MPSHRHPTRRYAAVDARRAELLRGFGRHPFTRRDALAAGLTDTDLRSDAVQPVVRGAFVAACVPIDHGVRCAATLATLPPGSSIAGVDAAVLHGLPAPLSERIAVCLPEGHRRRSNDIVVLPARRGRRTEEIWLPTVELAVAATAAEEVVEECGHLALVDAVTLADAVHGWCADRGLPLSESPPGGWRERSRIERVWRLARSGVESPMETRLRLLLVLAGFPEPAVQHPVVGDGGRYRLDLAYPDIKVAIEYDGSHHFRSPEQMRADRARDADLRRAGWIVIHVDSRGLFRDPAGTLREVAAAFAERGRRVKASAEWRRHFPQLAG